MRIKNIIGVAKGSGTINEITIGSVKNAKVTGSTHINVKADSVISIAKGWHSRVVVGSVIKRV